MNELQQALGKAKAGFVGVAVFTGVVNVLVLTGPLFMLQAYDWVLASHSTATLLVLLLIAAFLFAMMGFLDHVRGRVLARIGAGFQAALDQRVFVTVRRKAEVPKLRAWCASCFTCLAARRNISRSAEVVVTARFITAALEKVLASELTSVSPILPVSTFLAFGRCAITASASVYQLPSHLSEHGLG